MACNQLLSLQPSGVASFQGRLFGVGFFRGPESGKGLGGGGGGGGDFRGCGLNPERAWGGGGGGGSGGSRGVSGVSIETPFLPWKLDCFEAVFCLPAPAHTPNQRARVEKNCACPENLGVVLNATRNVKKMVWLT